MTKKPARAVIFGCGGLTLSPRERQLFQEINPLGFILFDRNVRDPIQLKQLVADLRASVGRADAPVLVDQEGGRIQRLWPPYWEGLPFCRTYGYFYAEDKAKALRAVKKHARSLARDLLSVGIDVDCWPCLDVAAADVHDVMGKRCFSDDVEAVITLGQAAVQEALRHGLMPVIKHIPGYGRTRVDPHTDLPVVSEPPSVLQATDFRPFREIRRPVWGMTAHVVYAALDDRLPVTLSRPAMDYIRREIGFDGFLVCDDMSMGALTRYGAPQQLAERILAAGCDAILHCNGRFDEMVQLAGVPFLSADALRRLGQARKELSHV